MYLPEHFAEREIAGQLELIRRAPLGTFVIAGEDGFEANHVPFIYRAGADGAGTLCAHIPRMNPLTRKLTDEARALVIFHGAQGYISPSWYATKAEHGRVVPTWNYAVVHAHGLARLLDDPEWVAAQLRDLTRQMESRRAEPWSVSDAPVEFTEKLIGSLVGLEIRVEHLEGKLKASQNQPVDNRRSILAALAAEQPGTEFTGWVRSVIGAADGHSPDDTS